MIPTTWVLLVILGGSGQIIPMDNKVACIAALAQLHQRGVCLSNQGEVIRND